jgi:transcriptional regulator with XRE-family HTH domain
MITPDQCRAARGLLRWSQEHLARMATVNHRTVVTFEKGTRAPIPNNVNAIQRALEIGGAEFTAEVEGVCGAGVRMCWRAASSFLTKVHKIDTPHG